MTVLPPLGPCVACGSLADVQRNHLAARANAADIVFPFCRACHDSFTHWQWRLGILRREPPDQRRQHSELERAWALAEGYVLTACLGGADPETAVALGRAAGTLLTAVAIAADQPTPWGPRPAQRRGSAESLPVARGGMHLDEIVRVAVTVCMGLGDDDPRLAAIAAGSEAIAHWATALDATGNFARSARFDRIADWVVEVLRALGSVAGPNDFFKHEAEIRWLAQLADQTLELLSALAIANTEAAASAAVERFLTSLS